MMASKTLLRRKLAENLRRVSDRVGEACARKRRDPAEVLLVAVTKYVDIDMIRALLDLGQIDLGERRVQALTQRAGMISELRSRMRTGGTAKVMPAPRWHMVGHLQRNKVRKAVQLFDRIDAVDSGHLREALSRISGELVRTTDVLIEVNTSGEPQKFGVEPEAALELAARTAEQPNLHLRGLMTIGPLTSDTSRIAGAFRTLKKLFDNLNSGGFDVDILSMGMSGDFEIAIAEGATEIRLGTALFGARSKL